MNLFSYLLPIVFPFFLADQPAADNSTKQPTEIAAATNEAVTEFTDANFNSKVIASKQLTVVDFWAEWCGPCRKVGPIVEKLAESYKGKVNIGKLNVDENPNIAMKYNITSIPTLLFIKNGKVVDKVIGSVSKSEIEKKIKAHL